MLYKIFDKKFNQGKTVVYAHPHPHDGRSSPRIRGIKTGLKTEITGNFISAGRLGGADMRNDLKNVL
ncbi:MAG: hypothetical protein A2W25_12470 [candidate division Zixibacteria bacterium RBG_16_53_22]|nr:MAG: hypothetical protein A2W25_12470 [candidate division Zixibacteria bacterium RBG_16_53_22]